jgi:quercetin dioxygenase-like cupin family protein
VEQLIQPYLLGQYEGTVLWFFGCLVELKDASEPSDGSITVIEQLAPPGFSSPYHLHTAEDELFYVLEGEMSFYSEGRAWKGGPGTFAFLPRNIPHGFRIEGTEPSRSLIIANSGAFENFVRELGEPAEELVIPQPGPMDMEKVMAVATKYQLQIMGPLPDYTV